MSDIKTKTGQLKKRVGDVAVAATLLVALWVSYGCGTEEPEVTQDRFQRAVPVASATPRATQAAMVSDESVAEVEPRHTDVTYEEADGAFRDKRYGEATDLFLIYATENPNNIWGHYMLGLSAWKTGVLPQAETSFNHALEIDSSHVKTLINLSRVLLDDGRPADALEHVQRVIEIAPESVDGLRLLGRANDDLGNPDEAIEAYVRAITLDPEDAWSMNNLGLVLIRHERFEEALRPLARAVEIRDDVSVFFNNLGIALERTDHGRGSADAYQRAVELDPVYEKAQQNLARAQNRNNDSPAQVVDLTVLAEEFRREVEGWQKPTVVTGEPVSVDSLPGVVR